MANRKADLTFSLLSDADAFDLATPARELEDLGDTAKDTARTLDDLDRDASKVDLEGTLGRDAKNTARKVDDAFDSIARSSKTSSRKVDAETKDIRSSLKEVGDEAQQTARESAASFSSAGDIGDAFQELAANAGVAFGPIGAALGIAAAAGAGLFRTNTEDIQTRVDELVDYMQEAGGRLTEAAIDSMVTDPENRGELKRLKALAEASDIAGVSFRDLARAKVGDEEAQGRLNDALDAAAEKYASTVDSAGNYNGVNDLMRARVKVLRQELDKGTEALDLAKEATSDLATVTGSTGDSVVTTASEAGGAWDDLRANLGKPIKARVIAEHPSAYELAQVRSGIMRAIGTIVVPIKPGQSRFANTADNSRYRW